MSFYIIILKYIILDLNSSQANLVIVSEREDTGHQRTTNKKKHIIVPLKIIYKMMDEYGRAQPPPPPHSQCGYNHGNLVLARNCFKRKQKQERISLMACMDRDDLHVFMFQVICFSVVLLLDAYDHQMLNEPWQSQCLTDHGRSNVT